MYSDIGLHCANAPFKILGVTFSRDVKIDEKGTLEATEHNKCENTAGSV